jgi:hypothetical protein
MSNAHKGENKMNKIKSSGNYEKSMTTEEIERCKNLQAIDIIEKYPNIYGVPPYDPMQNLLCFGFEVGGGWFPLIAKLSEDIQKILDSDPELNIQVVQVKEKYGGLRFYAHGSTGREIDALIDNAEEESENICENCGKPAVPQKSKGWIKTRCEDCISTEGKK